MQCIVSDMTAFRVKGKYYELTLYMDLWNNEILTHSLSAQRGDRMTYMSGLRMESINGWIKAEMFLDLHITGKKPIKEEIDDYIRFFNEERPAYSLNYMTPKQYKEAHMTDK